MTVQTISDKTLSTLMTMWENVILFAPDFIAAMIILLFGWIAKKISKKILKSTLARMNFDKLTDSIGLNEWLSKRSPHLSPSYIVATLVSTFIFLLFVVAALDALGLTLFTRLIDTIVLYLPKVLAAFAILVVGLSVAQLTFKGTQLAAKNSGIDYGRSIAELSRGIVIVITLSLAVTQLEVDVSLLNIIICVVVACIGLAAAISLGIGTRGISSEIVAGVYLREMFESGDVIEFEGVTGSLMVIGNTNCQIITKSGKIVSFPNTALHAGKVVKHAPAPEVEDSY
ncbi:cmpX protein [Pseudoalteromonas luteoviolacea B = ATCC 29581]|nr:cmpX protein [Pseudoalteromonas luteoviolacea B = ATCC 29581]